jgi:hypothetical protein
MDGEGIILGQCSYIFYTSLNIPGDYVKARDLWQGDSIVIYKDDEMTALYSLFLISIYSFRFVLVIIG